MAKVPISQMADAIIEGIQLVKRAPTIDTTVNKAISKMTAKEYGSYTLQRLKQMGLEDEQVVGVSRRINAIISGNDKAKAVKVRNYIDRIKLPEEVGSIANGMTIRDYQEEYFKQQYNELSGRLTEINQKMGVDFNDNSFNILNGYEKNYRRLRKESKDTFFEGSKQLKEQFKKTLIDNNIYDEGYFKKDRGLKFLAQAVDNMPKTIETSEMLSDTFQGIAEGLYSEESASKKIKKLKSLPISKRKSFIEAETGKIEKNLELLSKTDKDFNTAFAEAPNKKELATMAKQQGQNIESVTLIDGSEYYYREGIDKLPPEAEEARQRKLEQIRQRAKRNEVKKQQTTATHEIFTPMSNKPVKNKMNPANAKGGVIDVAAVIDEEMKKAHNVNSSVQSITANPAKTTLDDTVRLSEIAINGSKMMKAGTLLGTVGALTLFEASMYANDSDAELHRRRVEEERRRKKYGY